jgi:hypothetical protein
MKKGILFTASLLVILALAATAQTSLAPDQNPNYMVSQARYMKMADSVNSWHSTTPQETYKAIDYLEDKREARANRKAWRRELRMERARNSGWYNNGYYNDYYYPYNNNYNRGSYYSRPWGYRNNWNNYLWNSLPLAATVGLWWCR